MLESEEPGEPVEQPVSGSVEAGKVNGPTVSTTEAARRLGVSNSYVQQLLARGKLLGRRQHGARTVWRVDLGSLEQLAQKRATRPTEHRAFAGASAAADAHSDESRADSRAEMLELELVAARQELAELRHQLAREQMMVERFQAEIRDLTAKLSSVATAHVQVVQSLVPPAS